MAERMRNLIVVGVTLLVTWPAATTHAVELTRWSAEVDYQMWWVAGTELPPLLSTSPDGAAVADAGVLGRGGRTLFGGDEVGDELRSGGRVTLMHALDEDQNWLFSGSFAGAGSDGSGDFAVLSTGSPTIARPFFNLQTGSEDAELVAFVDPLSVPVVSGAAAVGFGSELHTANLQLRGTILNDRQAKYEMLAGYRYMEYEEGLTISESLISTAPVGVIQLGTTLDLFDQFEARNIFHGGELGLQSTFKYGLATFKMNASVAMGNVTRKVTIRGGTRVTTPAGGVSARPGGLLALPSNIGTFRSKSYAVMPQFGMSYSIDLTDHVQIMTGYDLMVLTDVYRVGDQIDRRIHGSQLTTLTQTGVASTSNPSPSLTATNMWAQAISFGLVFTH